jgi:hypothetical protein
MTSDHAPIQHPTGDDLAGFSWFNGLTDADRLFWLQQAGSAAPIAAWAAFKAVVAGQRQIQSPPPPMAEPGVPPKYGRGRGRPPKDASERVHGVSMRLTDAQRAKLARIGGSEAVRAWIDSVQEDGPKA